MNLTDEQLEQITTMSAALLPADEIGILLKLNSEERRQFAEIVKNHKDSPAFMAFHTGRITTKLELRKTVIKLAKNGSPAAEPIADKYINE